MWITSILVSPVSIIFLSFNSEFPVYFWPFSPKKSYQHLGVYTALWRFLKVYDGSIWLIYSPQLFNQTNLGVTVKVFCRCDRVHNQLTINKGSISANMDGLNSVSWWEFKSRSKASLIKKFHSFRQYLRVLGCPSQGLPYGFQTCLISPHNHINQQSLVINLFLIYISYRFRFCFSG